MSMTSQEHTWLSKYQALKPKVDEALDAIKDEQALASLVGNSSKLALAIDALTQSVKYRGLLGKGMASDPGHEHRLKVESDALVVLSQAAAEKERKNKEAAAAKASQLAKEQAAQSAMKAPDAFPTLAQAATIQPGKKTYTPPTPAKKTWKPLK